MRYEVLLWTSFLKIPTIQVMNIFNVPVTEIKELIHSELYIFTLTV